MEPEIGKLYTHFKGGIYKVLAVGTHSEDKSRLVVYVNMDHGGTWIRPLEMWNESVMWPDGVQRPRFKLFGGV